MKLAKIVELLRAGTFPDSQEWRRALSEVKAAIGAVVWPPGTVSFTINPSRGRGRGKGNGVKPIKQGCMPWLAKSGWNTDERHNPLRLDAVKPTAGQSAWSGKRATSLPATAPSFSGVITKGSNHS